MMLISLAGFSQALNSPYSNNGIGEIAFQGLPQNFAMGELGIGTYSPIHINLENPALLTYNNLSSFEVGLQGDFRKFSTSSTSMNESSLALRYLAMSFPLISGGKWVSSFALLPLSTVNYHTSSLDAIDNIVAQTDYYGQGGLTQLVWGNGFRLTKNLRIGIKAAYVFGSIENQTKVTLLQEDPDFGLIYASNFAIAHFEDDNYADFDFTAGASYKYVINENKFLHLGALYRISSEIDGSRDTRYERQSISGATGQIQELSNDEKISFDLPMTYGFGVSFGKFANYTVGVDVRKQKWDSSTPAEPGEVYRNTTSMSLGGEFIPNYESVSSYLARTTYRLGFSYKQSPYILNDKRINDFGINFGASFPVRGFSSLETGFKYGVRGTKKNDLIRESYFQFVLGATINDRWFIKRRYD